MEVNKADAKQKLEESGDKNSEGGKPAARLGQPTEVKMAGGVGAFPFLRTRGVLVWLNFPRKN